MFTTVFTKMKSSIFLLNLYQVSKKINAGKKKPNLEQLKRENKQTSAGELSAGMRESFSSRQGGEGRGHASPGEAGGHPNRFTAP